MIESFIPISSSSSVIGRETLLLSTFIVFTVICVIIQYHWKRRRIYKMVADFPGIPTVPILGNAQMFIGADSAGIYRVLTNIVDKYMPNTNIPLKLWFGPELVLISGNPEDLQTILTSPDSMEKCQHFYRSLTPIMGKAPLLYKPVPKWKVHRKIFQTVLNKFNSFDYIKDFQVLCEGFSNDLRDIIESEITVEKLGTSIDSLLIQTVCMCLMGSSSIDRKRLLKLLNSARIVIDISFNRMCKFWLHNDFIYKFTNDFAVQNFHLQYCEEYYYWYANNKREERVGNKICKAKNMKTHKEKHLLDLFLDLEESGEFTDTEVKDECFLFFGAGMDTSSYSIHIILLLIAMHPEVQDKVYEEVYDIFGNSDRAAEADDVREMKYLEMVIKESLRLYTPIPVIARKATKDLKLANCVIPAGTSIIVSPYAVHHNEKLYPNPKMFDPERFHPSVKRHPYSFMPFSGGPRNCIGYSFAILLIKMVISMVVRKYKLSTDCTHSDIKIKLTLTAKVADAKPIKFEERKVKST